MGRNHQPPPLVVLTSFGEFSDLDLVPYHLVAHRDGNTTATVVAPITIGPFEAINTGAHNAPDPEPYGYTPSDGHGGESRPGGLEGGPPAAAH